MAGLGATQSAPNQQQKIVPPAQYLNSLTHLWVEPKAQYENLDNK